MDRCGDTELGFLGRLYTLLERGDATYQRYLEDGKKFLYAKILKDNNERIRELILAQAHCLPVEYQKKAGELLEHIDIWHVLWEDWADRHEHRLEDEFVFENSAAFPARAVEALKARYLSSFSST